VTCGRSLGSDPPGRPWNDGPSKNVRPAKGMGTCGCADKVACVMGTRRVFIVVKFVSSTCKINPFFLQFQFLVGMISSDSSLVCFTTGLTILFCVKLRLEENKQGRGPLVLLKRVKHGYESLFSPSLTDPSPLYTISRLLRLRLRELPRRDQSLY
jgi:hypothetical protein